MNIKQARKIIQKAIKANATALDLSAFGDNKKLTSDDLEVLAPEIERIGRLRNLNLNFNKIDDLRPFAELTGLQTLFLDQNQITDLSPLAGLNRLSVLYLDENQISDLSPLAGLTGLRTLIIRRNPALEETIPAEILQNYQNPKRIINYWLSLTKGRTRPLNEAKVVIVGQGSVGKTTLIERIINNQYIEPGKTDGIDIRNWEVKVNDHNVKLNIWDFGGQEIMHATHQFFLTKRSLYLLALDCRLDKDESRLEYWLRKIESLGENSPVIIVGTKVDQHQFDLAQRDLTAKFPNIVGFYGVSAKTGEGIDELSSAITEQAGRLDGVHNLFPESWFAVKKELEMLDRDYVSFDEYSRICEQQKVNRENEDTDLVDLLHDLGIVLCFHKDSRLLDTNVLQPEWVTKGVYKILNARRVFENYGKLTVAMLPEILDKQKYPLNKYRFILDMMQKFELCYEIDNGQFLIPELFRNEEPYTGDWDGALRFQYKYKVFFSSIITRFIVRMHQRISDNTYWRNGVVLAYKSGGKVTNHALIKADTTDARISIAVKGEPNTRRDFLQIIRQCLDSIHQTFSVEFQAAIDERIPLANLPEISVSYSHLLTLEKKGVAFFIPEKSSEEIDVRTLLTSILPREQYRKLKEKGASLPAISRIRLENIRCFELWDLSLLNNEDVVNLTLIFGDNSAGKTTFLRSIAIGLCDEVTASAFLSDLSVGFLREGCDIGKIIIELTAPDSPEPCIITTFLTVSKSQLKVKKEYSGRPLSEQLFVCAYGSLRRGGGEDYDQFHLKDSLVSLFDYNKRLQNPELAIRRLESLGVNVKDITSKLDAVLILDEGSTTLTSAGLRIKDRLGNFKPLASVGDGFQSTVAWIADWFAWIGFFNPIAFQLPLTGIVLIDEIEQHLHPSWQREVLRILHEQFPRVQFIATSHSPMVALGTTALPEGTAKIVSLHQQNDQVVAYPNSVPKNQRADEVLTSSLFGLFSASGFDVSADIEEYGKLIAKNEPTVKEKRRAIELETRIQHTLGNYRNDTERRIGQLVSEILEKEFQEALKSKSLDKKALNFQILNHFKEGD